MDMFKKITAAVLCLFLVLGTAACRKSTTASSDALNSSETSDFSSESESSTESSKDNTSSITSSKPSSTASSSSSGYSRPSNTGDVEVWESTTSSSKPLPKRTKYYVKDYGIKPNQNSGCEQKLENLIESLPDNIELYFEKGSYTVRDMVKIHGKKNIVIDGNGATFKVYFEPSWTGTGPGLMQFEKCDDITIRNFKVNTTKPTNVAGKITSINVTGGTYDLELYDGCTITGNENLASCNSLDKDYSPDYKIATYATQQYTVLGNNKIRIKENSSLLKNVSVGQTMVYRHTIYGATTFYASKCNNLLMQDIRVFSAPGMTFIPSQCSNITFDNFDVKPPEDKPYLIASNADGIHASNTRGKLILKNCDFQNLGDDALNACGNTFIIKDFNETGKFLTSKNQGIGNVYRKGDHIEILHPTIYLKVAEFDVKSVVGDTVYFEHFEGDSSFAMGGIMVNVSAMPKVTATNCTVRNTRARGFLIRSRNVTVENCKFFGTSLAGILLAVDYVVWHESGPSKNVLIKNNTIEKCAFVNSWVNNGAINIRTRDDGGGFGNGVAGVHSNITIESNRIINCGTSGVAATSVKGITIKNNTFSGNGKISSITSVDTKAHEIVLHHCEDIKIEGNKTDRPANLKLILTS